MSWVACESCSLCRGCDQSQRSGGGDARGSIRVGVGWVAGEASAGGSRSDQRQGAVGRNALHTFGVLVGRVAGVLKRAGGHKAHGSKDGESLTHVVRLWLVDW